MENWTYLLVASMIFFSMIYGNEVTYPVDGNWAAWASYGACTVTCGGGIQTNTRSCSNPAPMYLGKACTGMSSSSRTCNSHNCPIDGQWTSWGSWGFCSVTCGEGSQSRKRTCTNPAPQYDGKSCPNSDTSTQGCNSQLCPRIEDDEIRVILIGRTGVGKSATGNAILGREAFKLNYGTETMTKITSFSTTRRFGYRITVVDTPGLADTDMTENEVLTEIVRAFTITSPGPHAFLLVVRPGRLSREERDILSTYKDFFGEKFENHLILVFTDKDRLEEIERTNIEEYISRLYPMSVLATLVKSVNNRYINIGYSYNFQNPDRTSEVLKIIAFVEEIKRERGFFTTEFTPFAKE